ncbi:hypothetical protein NSQ59_23480 [Margalitia sp. FSL K6-0131]|uniref:hypothetical protein n=1 Tax=Margalitia sp. FSL K6-0131 TaxID=2954604 RepID=UPI0030FA0F39
MGLEKKTVTIRGESFPQMGLEKKNGNNTKRIMPENAVGIKKREQYEADCSREKENSNEWGANARI